MCQTSLVCIAIKKIMDHRVEGPGLDFFLFLRNVGHKSIISTNREGLMSIFSLAPTMASMSEVELRGVLLLW